MVVLWSQSAKNALRQAFEYIATDSPQAAQAVINEIVDATLILVQHPERHHLDKFKKNNDGSWRAFELHRYRISYKVTEKNIRIVRMRHTSRNPLDY
ncbi:type II toxin-antitoxin system RelE/ParE family toxin [Pseudobacter ginsenosidimutans]|uniref:Addiction module RelE/StbE family toxin n=1 Tax=Pseudobacter ginsenosidimutans TaxID=661488 RepID=A0A4Q7N0J5_9BACT|nr:type II toxin-antitoxin system RelE/ParE family toxin [Pseudobacter ginsenosidimutans]RZS75100.1 addiction module RelE/StbE family toxin [Pseudobacter ginsenosidimutans]